MGYLRPEPWLLLHLFQIGRKSWLLHILVVTLVFLALHSEGNFPVSWILILVVTSLGLAIMSRYAANLCVQVDAARLMKLGVAHTIGCAIVGLTWGFGAFEAVRISPEVALFYSLALGGTALGAIFSQSAHIRSSLISVWTSITLLALAHWRYSPDTFGGYTGGLMIAFGLALSVFTLRMYGFLNENHSFATSLEQQIRGLKDTTALLDAARKEAAEANAAKSRFLAHASHDLRQPLHAIGLLNANMMHEPMSPQAMSAARQISKMVSNMSELFVSLLSFSALELGQIRPRISRFCLDALLQEVMMRNAYAARQAQCEIRVVPNDCWVETDRDLLLNILQNLVSNAIKYAQATPVTLECWHAKGHVSVSVSDRGGGIPDAETGAVFNEYYRLKGSQSRAVEGMGLGLTLVKRFSEIMGLSCSLSSAPDVGTRVTIGGLKVVPPQVVASTNSASGHVRLKGLKIHIVENDHEVLAATTELLNRWGCEVSHSHTIPHQTLGIDFLITDHALDAEINGKDCIEQVRRHEGRDIPAIIVTGQQGVDLARLKIAQPVGLLVKPAPGQKIRSLILSLLTRKTTR
jgi:signal transduction histidine kinase/CheY-like chemotaxis protein